MSAIAAVSSDNFEVEVVGSESPVVVDFWAEWCPPCRALAPVLESVAGQFSGRLKVFKCDVDTNEELAARYGAMRIPNLIFFKDGQVVDQTVGFLNEIELTARFERVLA